MKLVAQKCSRSLLFAWPMLVLSITLLTSCMAGGEASPASGALPFVPNGQAQAGAVLIREYGCMSCHVVPGVVGATGLAGPPLNHWAKRTYIAGALPNTPENLIAWIQDPQAIEPGTAMPNLGVSAGDARHMAAYLYTLE